MKKMSHTCIYCLLIMVLFVFIGCADPGSSGGGSDDGNTAPALSPEMTVTYNGFKIVDSGYFNTTVRKSITPYEYEIVIENTGESDLILSDNSDCITVKTNPLDSITISQMPDKLTVPAGESVNFKFTINTINLSSAQYTATFVIKSNVPGLAEYTMSVNFQVQVLPPRIRVSENNVFSVYDVINISDLVELDSQVINTESKNYYFTINNQFQGELYLTGNPPVIIKNDTDNEFSIQQPSETVLKQYDEVVFAIRYTPTSIGDKEVLLEIPSNDPGTDTEGHPRNPYYFSIGGRGISPPSVSTPENLIITGKTSDSVSLAWDDCSNNESGFIIERKTGVSGSYSELANLNQDAESYTDNSVQEGTLYYYRIKAFNSSAASVYSNEVEAVTILIPPSSLSLDVLSASQIKLSWLDNSSNENGFIIERKTGSSGTYSEITTVTNNIISFTDTNLSYGTNYYYRLKSYNDVSESVYSSEANAETLQVQPAAPDNAVLTPVSDSEIQINWNDNSDNEDGFYIERKKGADGEYSQIADLGSNQTEYNDTVLEANTEYYYRIISYNSVGNCGDPAESSVYTKLTVPEFNSKTYLSKGVILTWDSIEGTTGYNIYRASYSSDNEYTLLTSPGEVTGNSYSDTDEELEYATRYYYKISAYNATNSSNKSDYYNVVTAPEVPVIKLISTGSNIVTISPFKSSSSWYENIYRSDSENGEYQFLGTTKNTGKSYYEDETVNPGTTYYYKMSVTSIGGGESSLSTSESITPLQKQENLDISFNPYSREIELTWDETPGATSYKVYRATSYSGPYTSYSYNEVVQNSYSESSMLGQKYYYKVAAVNSETSCTGDKSDYVSTEIPAPVPINGCAVSDSSLKPMWSLSNSASGYIVFRKIDGGASVFVDVISNNSICEYTDTDVEPGRFYYYGIAVFTETGSSYIQWSNGYKILE